MARGGVSKLLVKQARDALVARGQNPSIDTVRIELGNTGSKTTIHRYLRELEESESTRLDDEALLSSTLKEMVARLAAQLHQEAGEIIEKAQSQHQSDMTQLLDRSQALQKELAQSRQQFADLQTLYRDAEKNATETNTLNQALGIQTERLMQQVEDQKVLLSQKDDYLKSLEEKHQHARDALNHYRASVKDQRDQDLRCFEQQLQTLQVEQRHLNQTISIKQSEISQLSTDNTRMLTQVDETRKQLTATESKLSSLEIKTKAAETSADLYKSKLEASALQSEEIQQLRNQLAAAEQTRINQDLELATLRSELAIKDQVFAKIGLTED